MSTTRGGDSSWLGATVDTALSVLVLSVVWYPGVFYANEFAGAPLATSRVSQIVFVLALGTAYPFVAGDWPLGALGEYVFLLVLAALAWGLVGMGLVLALGVELDGSNLVPEATLWLLAYASAYAVVFESDVVVFR